MDMVQHDVKQAREAAGLSVSEVARMAEVPRQQVYALEQGANVTLDTLRRIASVIPNLNRVMLGGMEIVTADADLEEARRAALDLFDVARRLMAALGTAPGPPSGSPPPSRSPSRRVRYGGTGSETERRTAHRLEKMIREGRHKRRPSHS
jgi:transcriptional regulator with XRE-family HTH domain